MNDYLIDRWYSVEKAWQSERFKLELYIFTDNIDLLNDDLTLSGWERLEDVWTNMPIYFFMGDYKEYSIQVEPQQKYSHCKIVPVFKTLEDKTISLTHGIDLKFTSNESSFIEHHTNMLDEVASVYCFLGGEKDSSWCDQLGGLIKLGNYRVKIYNIDKGSINIGNGQIVPRFSISDSLLYQKLLDRGLSCEQVPPSKRGDKFFLCMPDGTQLELTQEKYIVM